MKRTLANGVAGVLLGAVILAACASPAQAGRWWNRPAQEDQQVKVVETHRYIYIPMLALLVDLDNIDFGTAQLNANAANIAALFTGLDLGFTYLEGPELPEDWLDSPSNFAAVMCGMKRVDVAAHTQGLDIIYDNDVFRIHGASVPSIAYPPAFTDPEELHLFRLGGFFYYAWVYAQVNTGNILSDIFTASGWENTHGEGRLGRAEIVFRRNFKPYKVITYEPEDDPDGTVGRAIARECILEIVRNAVECVNFVVDSRLETRHSPDVDLFPSDKPPVDRWYHVVGRYHATRMNIEKDHWWARLFEPRLTHWPIRNPGSDICPDDVYAWYLPDILAPLHSLFSGDHGEMCGDVDTIVELDASEELGAATWWNPYPPTGFYEILNPAPFDDATARAWTFLHVAHNNGHRLIDTVNPVDGPGGPQIPSIIDVGAFDPDLYPGTFDGGPRIHGYHKRLVSPSIAELYKRFHYIYSAGSPAEFFLRSSTFRNNLGTIISDVHIYVMNPSRPWQKVEITVPELLQMIADRWSKDATYGLSPLAFLWTDMPEIDRGQGPPVVFEITCTFDTNPTLGGPYVPIRIIGEAHEAYYITNYYGDVFYQMIQGLLGNAELPF